MLRLLALAFLITPAFAQLAQQPDQLQQTQQINKQLQAQVLQFRQQRDVADAEAVQAEQQNSALNDKVSGLEAQLATAKKDAASFQKTIDDLKAELAEAKKPQRKVK